MMMMMMMIIKNIIFSFIDQRLFMSSQGSSSLFFSLSFNTLSSSFSSSSSSTSSVDVKSSSGCKDEEKKEATVRKKRKYQKRQPKEKKEKKPKKKKKRKIGKEEYEESQEIDEDGEEEEEIDDDDLEDEEEEEDEALLEEEEDEALFEEEEEVKKRKGPKGKKKGKPAKEKEPTFEELVQSQVKEFQELYEYYRKRDVKWIPFKQMEWVKRCCMCILSPAGCPHIPDFSNPDQCNFYLHWLQSMETLLLIRDLLLSYKNEIVQPTRSSSDVLILSCRDVYIWFYHQKYNKPRLVGKNTCPRCHQLLRLIGKESRLICPNPSCPSITYYYANMTFQSANYGATRMGFTHRYKRIVFFESYLRPYRQGDVRIEDQDLIRIWQKLTVRGQRLIKNEWKAKTIIEILQELGLSTKYKHCQAIILRRLSGFPIVEFTPEQFQEIMARVTILNDAYLKVQDHKQLKRTNFPKFSYVTNKFCMQNHWYELAEQFPLQRIPDKLKKQEEGWKILIDYLKANDKTFTWEFIPSG